MKALFGIAAVVMFLLAVYALIDCIRKRPANWIWWALFILVGGVFGLSLDLSTGDVSWAFPILSLLPVTVSRNAREVDAAWTLNVALPLGAIAWLAWTARRRSRVQK